MFGVKTKLKEEMLKLHGEVPREFYDADYYAGNIKSNWETAYDWQHFGKLFMEWAKVIMLGFPEAKSFLDVGCARGFLEKGMLHVAERSKLEIEIEGFDVATWAIENCEPEAKPFVSVAGVEDYEFRRSFDVMVCLDTFGHLTEEQVTNFLIRSRPHISDCGFFAIELSTQEHNLAEPSHVNLQIRGWWNDKFYECGWIADWETRMMTAMVMRKKFIKSCKVEIFVFKAKRKEIIDTHFDRKILDFARMIDEN